MSEKSVGAKSLDIVGAYIAFTINSLLIHLIIAEVWFCCDDSLAEFIGVPQVGDVPFAVVWLAPFVARQALATIFGPRVPLVGHPDEPANGGAK